MAHIQPENLQNAPKMHFWQKAVGHWVKEIWKFIMAEIKTNTLNKYLIVISTLFVGVSLKAMHWLWGRFCSPGLTI